METLKNATRHIRLPVEERLISFHVRQNRLNVRNAVLFCQFSGASLACRAAVLWSRPDGLVQQEPRFQMRITVTQCRERLTYQGVAAFRRGCDTQRLQRGPRYAD